MSANTMSEADCDALRVLIECMEQTPPLSHEEVVGLSVNQHAAVERMIVTGETWNQASSGPAFFSMETISEIILEQLIMTSGSRRLSLLIASPDI